MDHVVCGVRGGAWGSVAAVALLAGAPPGWAQERRALVEPPEVKAAVAKVGVAALSQDILLKDCPPKRHLGTAGGDWPCKVGALRLAAGMEKWDPDLPLARNPGLRQRARLVSLALDAADALGLYKPLSDPPADLPRWQVAAQAEACRAVQDLYGALLEVPESKPVAGVVEHGFDRKVAPRLDRPLKEVTCACHQRTLGLGAAGFMSDREETLVRARRQFLATGCNLKTTGREGSVVSLKKGSSDLDLSEHGGSAKGANVDQDEAQRVADRRKPEVAMCVEPRDRGRAGEEKLERCVCPLAMRWRFPKREVETVLQVKVEVAEKLAPVLLEVSPKGVVERCTVGSPRPDGGAAGAP
jgi:hypothetical protein